MHSSGDSQLGLTALGALVYAYLRQHLARWTVIFTLVLAVVSSGLIGYTANLGGKIHHQELRDQPTSTIENETSNETEHEEE